METMEINRNETETTTRKFIAEWGYGRPTGYFAEVELFKEELRKLELAIRYRKITGNDFGSSAIKSIELENGMKLYAEGSPEYRQVLPKVEDRRVKRNPGEGK